MVNDNKNDFMSVVNNAAEEYRKRSYEACMEGFMSSMIKEAVTIDAPKNVELGTDEKQAMLDTVTETIKNSANEFVKNAVVEETGTLYNVNVAHEIVNPKNLTESVMQLVSAHVFDEADDRAKMLEADFDAGKINNMSFEDAAKYVDTIYEPLFIKQLDNGKNLKKGLEVLMSTEGAELVDDIKDTVSKLVLETEAKNSVIREAVSEINETKAEIEKKINGETDEEKEANGDDNNNDTSSTDDDSLDDSMGDAEQAVEGLFVRAVKRSKKGDKSLSCEDLFTIRQIGGTAIQSGEDWSTNYDSTSFSREAAEDILDQFRELDDGIDPSTVNDDEAYSVSNDNGESCIDNEGSSTAESAENTYEDDDGNVIEEFQSQYNGEITPDPIPSIEAMVQQIMPMNLKKIGTQKFEPFPKLTAFLACQEDGGKTFFDVMRNRAAHATEMLDKTENDVIDGIAKSDIEKQIADTCDKVNATEEGVSKLLEDMGIAGILDNKFQRTANPVDNAMKSMFNPEILKPMTVDAASQEELHEHELADIFKLALKVSDVKSEIANRSDVIGNKEQLGYLEELLNEKMVNLEPNEKFEVESKVEALQSIESQVSLSDLMDMKVFHSTTEGEDNERVTLNSLKDIDAYGYSFFDEAEKIKESVRSNWNDKLKNSGVKYNIDTDKLVEFILEEQDTTKIDSNIFEKVLSKLAQDKTIENSTEALILRNKAKAITTSYLAADKLGFLSKEDITDIRNFVMN